MRLETDHEFVARISSEVWKPLPPDHGLEPTSDESIHRIAASYDAHYERSVRNVGEKYSNPSMKRRMVDAP